MGRKIRHKREQPRRNAIFKQLRTKNTTEEFNDRRGNSVFLSMGKRILFDRAYINPEYEKERIRMMQKIQREMMRAEEKS